MTSKVPRLVTIRLEPTPNSLPPIIDEPLCTAELLSLVDELANAGVSAVRFITDGQGVHDRGLRAIEHARRRRLKPTVGLVGNVDDSLVGAIAEAGAVVISVPLHSHCAAVHDAIDCAVGAWRRSVRIAGMVRDHKCALEVDTRVTPLNALPLLPLMETILALRAVQWRLAFDILAASGTFAVTATRSILQAVADDRVGIVVHRLPQLRLALATAFSGLSVPALHNVTVIDAGDEMWISSSGNVSFDALERRSIGNIRHQAIEAFGRPPQPQGLPAVEAGALHALA